MLPIDSVLVNNKSISFGQSKALNPCFVGGTIKNEAQLAAHVVVVAVFYFGACLVLFQAPFPCQQKVRTPQNLTISFFQWLSYWQILVYRKWKGEANKPWGIVSASREQLAKDSIYLSIDSEKSDVTSH